MSERTPNQTKREEEQARQRVELVEFQYGVEDLVSRLGTTLSSLVVFGGVLYIAGGLHAWVYFSAFGAEWLLFEAFGNSFLPSRVLPQVMILIVFVTAGSRLIQYAESKRKKYAESKKWMKLSWWSWVWNLNLLHEPHKAYMVTSSLLYLLIFLGTILFQTPPFKNPLFIKISLFIHPLMVTHPYWWSYGIPVLWILVFVPWAVVVVLAYSRNTIFVWVLVPIVFVLTIWVLFIWRQLFVGYTTWIFTGVWGILFGIGVGVRVMTELAHSNGGSLPQYSIPSPREGWSAANASSLFYVAFVGLFVFSSADGAEQSWYDQNASRSRLPIVMLEEGNPSCRQALLITSRRVYTVILQPLERRLDVVPFSWEKISQIQIPEFGRCPTS